MPSSLILVRSAVTIALSVLFILLCAWACSPRRRAQFEAAARLPLEGEEGAPRANEESH